MSRPQAEWKKIIFIYILQLFSYATLDVQLVAPRYIKFGANATLLCNHTAEFDDLHKIEFKKDGKKILEYIRDRKDPFRESPPPGISHLEHTLDGKTIKLVGIRFDAAGEYSCLVSTTYPIYTESSEEEKLQVIVPQLDNPHIFFKQAVYTVGEVLEANCTSSPAYPAPHLTWLINGKEVDMTRVTSFPHRHIDQHLMSATSKLSIEVSNLHVGENGVLEIACQATIPDFLRRQTQYADIKTKTVTVDITVATTPTSSSSSSSTTTTTLNPNLPRGLLPIFMLCVLSTMHKINPF
ncbi:hypothetical protein HCN44_007667 [Aphidius gifuensis]|uniref:Ig-like domain-containing protein n=1 Tax=Aphidius gifuensis TaxID=684658 RepID=A0A835CNI6_APHGI|nr:uncharacterized protein LOC122858584 [Aphidius gifuensis]KAF7988173.1 hypothetical protein HCN44_007667 [Aphidius gifuensis]